MFLLFEDTKKTHRGFSFSHPVARIHASTLDDVKPALSEIESWQAKGYYVAGYMSYEAGWALMSKSPAHVKQTTYPLLDFYVFKEKNPFHSLTDDAEKAHVYDFQSNSSLEEYQEKLGIVFKELSDGNTYQVNFTQRMNFRSTGDAWLTYQTLRREQRVEYAAFFNLPGMNVLSFSPELFLRKTGTRLQTKPMKGTAPRDTDLETDRRNKQFLASDLKNRAENVMIVDLLRNDMGKIATPGSVKVNQLFAIEEYETVYQMVSEIECELSKETSFKTVFENLFPCGSITGAPKLKTMEIISELEQEPRGIYTGALGYLEPNGDFCFNVAIRTLVKHNDDPYVFGTGGGILIDSNVESEYHEALLKSRFVAKANADFYLFETMLFSEGKFKSLPEHLARLEKSAHYFAFQFPTDEIKRLMGLIRGHEPRRVRLSLWNDGGLEAESFIIEALPPSPEVVVSTSRIDSQNIFQQHKTSRRNNYDDQYKKARTVGFYDVLYLNERQDVAEASRHNIFAKIQGQWYTPPIASGALPGIEREKTLNDLAAREKNLKLKDLKEATEILLTNSVRGRVKVSLRDAL